MAQFGFTSKLICDQPANVFALLNGDLCDAGKGFAGVAHATGQITDHENVGMAPRWKGRLHGYASTSIGFDTSRSGKCSTKWYACNACRPEYSASANGRCLLLSLWVG